ncbi:hypothetical protein M758_11G113300 [Ceratodon purpureus]|nr:hypothetical protein M758_11G113300 [Ceratodon purpureus]
METFTDASDGLDAPRGASTPLLGAQNTMPVIPPLPAVPNSGDVTINILPGSLQPAAGSGPDSVVSNDPVVEQSVVLVRTAGEVRINNLVDMQIKQGVDPDPDARKKLVALEALKEWKEAQSGLEGKVERKTKQTDKIIYEIYQLVGLYSVFVGVVFTAALQSSNLQCQHIWSPVLLCVVAWLIIILVTRKRLKRYKALRATIKSEDKARREIYGKIGNLKAFGHVEFDFTIHAAEKPKPKSPKPKSTCGIRVTASWVIPFVLTSLTLILVGSFIHILCLKDIASGYGSYWGLEKECLQRNLG